MDVRSSATNFPPSNNVGLAVTCIHCHQNCPIGVPACPVIAPSASTTFSMPVILPRARIEISPAASGLTGAVTRMLPRVLLPLHYRGVVRRNWPARRRNARRIDGARDNRNARVLLLRRVEQRHVARSRYIDGPTACPNQRRRNHGGHSEYRDWDWLRCCIRSDHRASHFRRSRWATTTKIPERASALEDRYSKNQRQPRSDTTNWRPRLAMPRPMAMHCLP